MSDEHPQDVSEVIAFFQKLPLPEMQCAQPGGSSSQATADLIREWRRMEQRDLPVAACAGLARCDDNTLFNVVGHCFDILLRRIVPRNNLRRRRRKEKRQRYRLQREAASGVALAAAFGGNRTAANSEEAVASEIERQEHGARVCREPEHDIVVAVPVKVARYECDVANVLLSRQPPPQCRRRLRETLQSSRTRNRPTGLRS